MNVSLVWITPDAEKLLLYMARVSNPENQNSEKTGLIKYLINNKHWSPFEMADACFEIKTSRAISAQICRHRSFSFQEFSQRYATVPEVEMYEARMQDPKNRQNSIIISDDRETLEWFWYAQKTLHRVSFFLYNEALRRGIAKESARFLLPMAASTTLYMKGTLRSWIHYLAIRNHPHAQKEHRDIAVDIQKILIQQLPITSKALGWSEANSYE